MRKVLILIGRNSWEKSRPFETTRYRYSYEFFYNLCKKNGIQMLRASYQWYDYEKNVFKYAWVFERAGNKWKRVENIKPDLIYDKTKGRKEVYYKKELIRKSYPFINDLQFTEIVDDKFLTGLIFAPWSKKNYLVDNRKDFQKNIVKIKSSKFVLKPLTESGGNGVYVLDKKEKLPEINFSKRYLLQEFIDSSKGVPGVSKKMHDLRLVFINDKIIYSYIREPKKGSYLANIAQGGTLKIIQKEKLPHALKPIIDYTNDAFSSFYPRVFSIDFMFDENKKPWIVELNSMPGMYFSPAEKPYMIELYKELLAVFKEKINN
jgi:glutathione synthase/RimK-type ligase-like ATP-grasp enzyme